jgi:hypothetical protein
MYRGAYIGRQVIFVEHTAQHDTVAIFLEGVAEQYPCDVARYLHIKAYARRPRPTGFRMSGGMARQALKKVYVSTKRRMGNEGRIAAVRKIFYSRIAEILGELRNSE